MSRIFCLALGAVGPVALTVWAGRHNRSWLLVALFVGWTLSPFVGLWFARRWARGWWNAAVAALALCSVLVYGAQAMGPRRAQAAAAFLITPLGELAGLAIAWLIVRRLSPLRTGPGSKRFGGGIRE